MVEVTSATDFRHAAASPFTSDVNARAAVPSESCAWSRTACHRARAAAAALGSRPAPVAREQPRQIRCGHVNPRMRRWNAPQLQIHRVLGRLAECVRHGQPQGPGAGRIGAKGERAWVPSWVPAASLEP